MVTVDDVNKTFAEKGIYIDLPLPPHLQVKNVEVLEKRTRADIIELVLRVKFINEGGKETSSILSCRGKTEVKMKKKPMPTAQPQEALKSVLLPIRERGVFIDEEEATSCLKKAISHLLQDKGYRLGEQISSVLYFHKGEQRFFINLAARCDEAGLEKTRELVELRRKHGSTHDYGLVVPAFQESLGIPLRLQERWVWRYADFLSGHRIGVYAVDNHDPNHVYPLTIYPKAKELMRYFMVTSQQWPLVRDRYVTTRATTASKSMMKE